MTERFEYSEENCLGYMIRSLTGKNVGFVRPTEYDFEEDFQQVDDVKDANAVGVLVPGRMTKKGWDKAALRLDHGAIIKSISPFIVSERMAQGASVREIPVDVAFSDYAGSPDAKRVFLKLKVK